MPLIPTLGRQRQVDLCEFEASLVYIVSSRTGSKATEKPCLEKPKPKPKPKKKKEGTLFILEAVYIIIYNVYIISTHTSLIKIQSCGQTQLQGYLGNVVTNYITNS